MSPSRLGRLFPNPTAFLRPTYYFLLGTCSTVLIRDNIASLSPITGSSMSPALSPSYHATSARDLVLFTAFRHSTTTPLSRGDIISFRKPHDPEGISVKRVVGLPGDVVVTRTEQQRGKGDMRTGKGRVAWPWRRVVVPYGCVWVEGDNFRASLDSNDFGPVSVGLVVGRAVGVVWPVGRMGWVRGNEDDGERTRVVERREVPGVPREWM